MCFVTFPCDISNVEVWRCCFFVPQTELENGPRLRASEAAVHEGHGGPAVAPEPAQQHTQALRGGCEESRLLPVSWKPSKFPRQFFSSVCPPSHSHSACEVLARVHSLAPDIFTADCIQQISLLVEHRDEAFKAVQKLYELSHGQIDLNTVWGKSGVNASRSQWTQV